MISYDQALEIIKREASMRRAHRIEALPLHQCIGRHNAYDVVAPDSNPRFDNSAMDGFLVCSHETANTSQRTPVKLEVVGTIAAGHNPQRGNEKAFTSLEIMTGAMIPTGRYDAVVRLEDVVDLKDHSGKRYIILRSPVGKGDNIRFKAEDIRVGELLIPQGTQITPEHILTLSTVGIAQLEVLSQPHIQIFSTGNEIVPYYSTEIEPYQIRNSTAPFLTSALSRYDANISFHGTAHDNIQELNRTFSEIIKKKPNIIISTGGVSVGKFDLVRETLLSLNASIHFHKVAVRPGKPILFAEFPDTETVFFGLPGNPVAVAAGIRFFVKPYIQSYFGEICEKPIHLALTESISKPQGLSFFQRGIRDLFGVKPVSGQASFMVSSLMKAEGWLVGPPESETLEEGDFVEWYSLW